MEQLTDGSCNMKEKTCAHTVDKEEEIVNESTFGKTINKNHNQIN